MNRLVPQETERKLKSLLNICLHYIKNNINTLFIIPSEGVRLYSVDDALLIKLAEIFSNIDVENLITHVRDRCNENCSEKINHLESILYPNLIFSLTLSKPETQKGHYWSLSDVYECKKCKKLISSKISDKIQCVDNYILISRQGDIMYLHEINTDWDLIKYIEKMKNEFNHSFRYIYWHIWSSSHYLFCTECNLYYSLHYYDKCYYHSKVPIFHSVDRDNKFNLSFPIGSYQCCGRKAYVYNCVPATYTGCRTKFHSPLLHHDTTDIINIFNSIKDLLFFDDNNNASKIYIEGNDKKLKFTFDNDTESIKCTDLRSELQLYTINKNVYRRGLIGQLLDKNKLQQEKIGRYSNKISFSDTQLLSHNRLDVSYSSSTSDNTQLVNLKSKPLTLGLSSKKSKLLRSFRSTMEAGKSKNMSKSGYSKEVESMELLQHHKDNKKKNTYINENGCSLQSNETLLYSEGCCLPLQEVNSDEKYFNKPIQYKKRSNKHKKMKCGLQSNLWRVKFSTRFNQDKQRENEHSELTRINSWLTEHSEAIYALTDEKIINDYLANLDELLSRKCDDNVIDDMNENRISIDHNDNEGDTSDEHKPSSICCSTESLYSTSRNSISSYCSTINSTIRVHHSRTTTVWNSFMPLAGTFVSIETEWRDVMHNNLNSLDVQNVKNKNSNNSIDIDITNYRKQRFTNTRLKPHSKYQCHKGIQTLFNAQQHSNKHQGEFNNHGLSKKISELPLTNCTKDYDQIWCYKQCSNELDYLSPTYMPIQHYKQFRFGSRELQSDWEDIMNLEKSWSTFLRLFFENELLPDYNSENKITRTVQLYQNVYDLYAKIDTIKEMYHTEFSREINSDGKLSGNAINKN